MSNPDEHIVLPETISKEPLGPVVRQGDLCRRYCKMVFKHYDRS